MKKLLISALLILLPTVAAAQSMTFDLGLQDGGSTAARMIQIVLLLTVLSLAPSILVMVTSFTRIIVVMSFLRTAMGTQQTPPNQVLVSLALFLTVFVMAPVFEKSCQRGGLYSTAQGAS